MNRASQWPQNLKKRKRIEKFDSLITRKRSFRVGIGGRIMELKEVPYECVKWIRLVLRNYRVIFDQGEVS